MSKVLIKNGLVIDPSQNLEKVADIYVVDGKIAEIGEKLEYSCDTVINAEGHWVTPGFVELHAHFREPGFEHKEDIASGSRAAVKGGYTTVCVMPNTSPVIDNEALVTFVSTRAATVGLVKLHVIGAISKGLKGEQLAEMAFMKRAGAVAFSDDGNPVMNAQLMRNAMEYASMLGLPIISHAEDMNLSRPGVINEGFISTKLGLPAMPKAAEEVMIARDIILAELTGAHLHIAHVSTARGVELIRQAKARGVRVTAEVTPHHLLLTDQLVAESSFDPNTKVNPPLREECDAEALLAGLLDGTIDAIATDHAPHHQDDKDLEYNYAAFGISGLETAFAALNQLVSEGKLPRQVLIDKLTAAPARALNLNVGTLQMGQPADITIIDPSEKWLVTAEALATKGKNTPWLGQELTGKVKTVLVNGQIKLHQGELYG